MKVMHDDRKCILSVMICKPLITVQDKKKTKKRSNALVAEKNEIADQIVAQADLLLCCSHTVVNGILAHHVASQLINEPTFGMVVFFCIAHPPLYSKTGIYRGIVILIFALKHRLWVHIRTASNR